MKEERMQLTTKDGVVLYGIFVPALNNPPVGGAPAIVLLHMMPAVKESWAAFQAVGSQAGFQSLAIDLRGHGESIMKEGQKIDYRQFTDAEHREKIHDAEAAVRFFLGRGVPFSSIALAGASIGANLALAYQAEHGEVKASVLLSPGLDYRGLKTEPFARGIKEEQSIFVAAAKDDERASGNSCADMAQTLFDISKSNNKKIKIFDGAEHGTDMFRAHPELMHDIIAWLREIYFSEL